MSAAPGSPDAPTTTPLPVTVVVPVHREGEAAGTTLAAVLRQQPAFVHVVATTADAATLAVIDALAAEAPGLRVLKADGALPGAARNVGTAAATTPWVAYLDAGTLPDPHWLPTTLVAVEAAHGDAGFPFVTAATTRMVARWYALAYLPPARQVAGGVMRWHHVPGMVLRRQVWEATGGFPDLRAAEDNVFVAALAGHPLIDVPGARITWHGPDRWAAIWRRTVLYTAATWRSGHADWAAGLGRWWAIVAVAFLAFGRWGSLIVTLLLAFRAARRVGRHRHDPDLGRRQFWDVPGTALVLAVIDLAMLAGVPRARQATPLPRDWSS